MLGANANTYTPAHLPQTEGGAQPMLGGHAGTYTPAHLPQTEGAAEVCRSFRNNGSCRFGDDCRFEHSAGDPIAPPERRERGECFNFRDSGDCAHGDRCRFTHGENDTRHTGNIEDEICRNYQRGRCNLGDECRRKHEGTPTPAAAGEEKPRRARAAKPVKKLDEACNNFAAGKCRLGDKCRRQHVEA